MPTLPRSATTRVVVATTVMLSFISFWRASAIVLSDLASSAYYVGGIAETSDRQVGALVHSGHHAVLLRGPRHLRGKLQHVRARRRVQSGARGHGRHAGQVLGFRPDVRLRAHRPHQRRQRRTLSGRPDQRHRRAHASEPARAARDFRRGIRHCSDDLLLAEEHHRHSRVELERRCASCRSPP